MNSKQKLWVNSQQEKLNSFFENSNFTEEEFEKAVDFVSQVIDKSKNNEEVRSEMLDILETWERKYQDGKENKLE